MTAEKDDRKKQMKKVRDEVWALKESPLYEYRTQNNYHAVIGEGDHYAKIMFIGEGPGKNEALQGRPFCGAAGKILDELLESVGIERSSVYIGNILKDRPPENRDPLPEEIAIYGPFLDRQIEIIKPEVIVPLGRYAMKYIMEKFGLEDYIVPISQAHGRRFEAQDLLHGKITIIPMYHPAVSVYNVHTKDTLKEDFKILEQFK